MWPGVVTTGLFSFLLAYNDFAVTAMLLSQENQTMVPKIASFLGSTQAEGRVMYAVAAVVSAIAPLFVLVLFFQRQIVSGLTAGAGEGGETMAELRLKHVCKRWGSTVGCRRLRPRHRRSGVPGAARPLGPAASPPRCG